MPGVTSKKPRYKKLSIEATELLKDASCANGDCETVKKPVPKKANKAATAKGFQKIAGVTSKKPRDKQLSIEATELLKDASCANGDCETVKKPVPKKANKAATAKKMPDVTSKKPRDKKLSIEATELLKDASCETVKKPVPKNAKKAATAKKSKKSPSGVRRRKKHAQQAESSSDDSSCSCSCSDHSSGSNSDCSCCSCNCSCSACDSSSTSDCSDNSTYVVVALIPRHKKKH